MKKNVAEMVRLYSLPLSRSTLIKELANKNFEGELVNSINNVIEKLTINIYLIFKKSGIEGFREAFYNKEEVEILDSVDRELEDPKINIDLLSKKYSDDMYISINALYKVIANIITKLLM